MKTDNPRAGNVGVVLDDLYGHGSTRISHLLFETACNFARRNWRFHQATAGDFPLAYTEKSLQSTLFSSISDTGAVVFSEQPVRRKLKGKDESYGWVDLWVYSRQLTYVIETKHRWLSWRSGVLNDSIAELWSDAVDKVKAVTSGSLIEWTYGSAGVCKVALLTLTLYQTSAIKEGLQVAEAHEVCELGSDLALSLSPKAKWSAVWTLSAHLQEPIEWFGERYISYPGVLFCAWVAGPYLRR
jgi:hypothetical protein